MSNKEHEENIQKEFEKAETEFYETTYDEKGSVNSFGKVDTKRITNTTTPDDPEIKRLNELSGHVRLNLENLPSAGRFYREDFEIHIRSAKVAEIRDFSTMDEENIQDIDDKLNNILLSCAKVMYGKQRGSFKDILEEDRVYVILSIRELTFKEGEQKLMMPITNRECKTSSCKSQESVELKTTNLQFQPSNDTLEKYYDYDNKCYSIQTKSHGTVVMAPPTIGVMRAVTEFVKKKEQEGKPWDKAMVTIIPYVQREWRGFNNEQIFDLIVKFQSWSSSKYSVIYRLAEMMKVGIKPEMIYSCQSCGAEVTVPLSFPSGIKSLFVISDITTELL